MSRALEATTLYWIKHLAFSEQKKTAVPAAELYAQATVIGHTALEDVQTRMLTGQKGRCLQPSLVH